MCSPPLYMQVPICFAFGRRGLSASRDRMWPSLRFHKSKLVQTRRSAVIVPQTWKLGRAGTCNDVLGLSLPGGKSEAWYAQSD
jgi:hypothetical protein